MLQEGIDDCGKIKATLKENCRQSVRGGELMRQQTIQKSCVNGIPPLWHAYSMKGWTRPLYIVNNYEGEKSTWRKLI